MRANQQHQQRQREHPLPSRPVACALTLALALLSCLVASGAARPVPLQDATTAAGDRGVARWSARLLALDPSRPEAYLLLGEDIVSRGGTPEEDRLAAELFALSGALSPTKHGRSAALAVAAVMNPSRPDEARIRAAAQALARVRAGTAAGRTGAANREALVEAASAAADIRAGRMSQARARLKDPRVADAFRVISARAHGGADRLMMDMNGQRDGARPPQSAEDVEAVLLATAAALDRADASWSFALVRTNEAPLLWVDESGLAEMIGVSTLAPLWRDGRWVPLTGPAQSRP